MKATRPNTGGGVPPLVTTPVYQPDPNEVTVFAMTTFRKRLRKFGIKLDDRRRHMYLVGKTGMGKSTLLENMIISDIAKGKGLAVVDPHGDLVEKVLKFIPNDRINDIVYFNPSDGEFPIAFNIVESINPEYKNLIASGLVGVFKKIWADSWGPRLEYILINSILALLDYPGSTLLGVTRLLVDKKYRKKIVDEIQDPVVKSFWVDEYANYSEKFRTEAIAPIQNKVGQFLSSAIIRNIVGQPKSTIDMREIMDGGKILLMNLAKGRIGEENSALLGAMMITKLQLAAMSRVDIPENTRRDFYLYVDEFQNFATESFANILSEARKYRLNLIIAHQYIEQLGEVVKPAVFGNVGTMVVFRVGAADAAEFEVEFEPTFTPADIVNIPKYHMYMKLMIDGVSSQPFSAMGLPPVEGETNNLEKIINASREHYGRPKKEVEQKIMQWAGMGEEAGLLDAESEEKPEEPEKIQTLNPREFKERLKLIQGSDQKIVPELAQKTEIKEAQSVSLMDALKGGGTVSFGGKPAPVTAPKPAAAVSIPNPTVPTTPVSKVPPVNKPFAQPTPAPQVRSTPPVPPPPRPQQPKSQVPPVPKPQPPVVVSRPPTPVAPKAPTPTPASTMMAPEPLDLMEATPAPKPAAPKPIITPPAPAALVTPSQPQKSETERVIPIPPPAISLGQIQHSTQNFEQNRGGGQSRRRNGNGGGNDRNQQQNRRNVGPAPVAPKPASQPTPAPRPAPSQPTPITTPHVVPQPTPIKPTLVRPSVAPSFLKATTPTEPVTPVTPPTPPAPQPKPSSAPSFIKPPTSPDA